MAWRTLRTTVDAAIPMAIVAIAVRAMLGERARLRREYINSLRNISKCSLVDEMAKSTITSVQSRTFGFESNRAKRAFS